MFKDKIESAKASNGHIPERKIYRQFLYMWMSFCIHKAESGELQAMLPADQGSPADVVNHFVDLHKDLQTGESTTKWGAFYGKLKQSLADLRADKEHKAPVSSRPKTVHGC